MKPVIAVLWILSIALAVGLTRLADPDQGGSEPSPSFAEAFAEFNPLRRAYLISRSLEDLGPENLPELLKVLEGRQQPLELHPVAASGGDGQDARGGRTW